MEEWLHEERVEKRRVLLIEKKGKVFVYCREKSEA